MIWYIAFKDIISFWRLERKVFIWLLVCMISGSFVLNYSYSFARYRGELYEYYSGETEARYKIVCDSTVDSAKRIFEQILESNLPEIDNYQIFGKSTSGCVVIGSSYISSKSASFTGFWTEGYFNEIKYTEENVCAVDSSLLDYGDRLIMVGEKIELDGEQFTIKGVYESFQNNTGVVIFANKFLQKYDMFDSIWITFNKHLNNNEIVEFERIIKLSIPHGSITYPPEPGTVGADTVKLYKFQYTAVIILLVVCLVSLIKYWQFVNLPAYTIYWINGATNSKIMGIALCESLVLSLSTYLVGLGLNWTLRPLFSRSAALTYNDIFIGFITFFGTFAFFTLINTAKICEFFNITNIRRD